MLPMCNPQTPFMVPMCPAIPRATAMPGMMPMIPIPAVPPVLCPPNMNLLSMTTTTDSEFNANLYGRFRHVERDDFRYRHAPFDWYKPPKSFHNIVHEDAAVVTADGPVPIGDFYRHYIYGEGEDDDSSSSFENSDDDGDDDEDGRFTERSSRMNNRRNPRRNFDSNFDEDSESFSTRAPTGNYSTLNSARRSAPATTNNRAKFQGNRLLAGDDEFDDSASVNSTYGN